MDNARWRRRFNNSLAGSGRGSIDLFWVIEATSLFERGPGRTSVSTIDSGERVRSKRNVGCSDLTCELDRPQIQTRL